MLSRSEHYVAYMCAEELGYEGGCACSQKTTMVRIDMLALNAASAYTRGLITWCVAFLKFVLD